MSRLAHVLFKFNRFDLLSIFEIEKTLFSSGFSEYASEARMIERYIKIGGKLSLEEIIERRKKNEPLAYILGFSFFYGYEFLVDKSTLIPRFDSETVVELAIDYCQKLNKDINIVDICTGSGCMLISLINELKNKSNNKITGTGIDISHEACDLLLKNAVLFNLKNEISSVCMDMLKPEFKEFIQGCNFNILISNPPYIRTADINTLDDQVKKYEPILALDGGEDGLLFYRKMIQIVDQISPEAAFIEIGYDQRNDIIDIFSSLKKYELGFKKDIGNNDRCIFLEKKR